MENNDKILNIDEKERQYNITADEIHNLYLQFNRLDEFFNDNIDYDVIILSLLNRDIYEIEDFNNFDVEKVISDLILKLTNDYKIFKNNFNVLINYFRELVHK